MKIKCPNCQTEKSFNIKSKKCINTECELSLSLLKDPFNWKQLFWKIVYFRYRDLRAYVCNRFFNRYDLVRTGLPKHKWMDVDYRMFLAVMNLVEFFVIEEEGIYYVDEDEYDDPSLLEGSKRQNKRTKKINDLYVDYKVTYSLMQKKHNDMLIDDDCPNDVYFAYEESINKYENQLMRRAINLRHSMWM